MAVETELKLRISPDQLAKLKRHPMLKQYTVRRAVVRRLYNVYFDTPDHQLRQSRMALRLRRAGRQWLQTLKGGGGMHAGLHQRNEWESPVNGPQLDFSVLPAAERESYLPVMLRERLQPVFVTDFVRSSRILDFHGAQIELCIDQGEISTAEHRLPVCELELELLSGEPRQLFELAQAFLQIATCELEGVSKAEQGYRLLSGEQVQPAKSKVPGFAPTEKLGQVLGMLLWSGIQHFQANLDGALLGRDSEYLHQLRVALRRLRVLMRCAERVVDDRQLASLLNDAAALGTTLGQIRAWDVFVEQTLRPLCGSKPLLSGSNPGRDALQRLLAEGERCRADSCRVLRSEAQRRALQYMLLRMALWMHDAVYWSHAAWQQPAKNFAIYQLNRMAKRFSHAAKELARPGPDDVVRLHRLRIIGKKLRYSADFFLPLFDSPQGKLYVAALGGVQDILGQIHDNAEVQQMLGRIAQQGNIRLRKTAGWVQDEVSRELPRYCEEVRHAMRRFMRQKEFW